ncbi:MAG: hypothetical protein JST38_18425 [Bacteroidetes bacterium]|nr:hypothetical protein [Bacteroidota bacterium]
MPLTEIDRIRIHDDLDQLQELVERKQYLWETDTRTDVRGELEAEIADHQARIAALQQQLAQ